MANTPTDFEDQLSALRRSFLDGLPSRMKEIDGLAATIAGDIASPSARDNIVVLRMLIHKLAGAGGTFGHLAVGDAASWTERAIDDILGRQTAATADQWRQVESRLEKLRRAADNALTARRKTA